MQLSASKLAAVVIAVVVGAAVFLLWPRAKVTPEDVIREKVEKMAAAAGDRDVAFITSQLSERFRGREGADKQMLKGIIASQILRGELVQVFVTDQDVKLTSDSSADFSGKFIFARQTAKDAREAAARDGMSGYRIDGKLEKESDGEWRFVSADYRQVGAMDAL